MPGPHTKYLWHLATCVGRIPHPQNAWRDMMGCVAGADDTAPPARKSRWLATFYLCIPVGYAAGYILGGLIAPALGWRAAFLLEAAAMVPFAAFCAVGPPLDLKGKHPRPGTLNCDSCLASSRAAAAISFPFHCAVPTPMSHPCNMPVTCL